MKVLYWLLLTSLYTAFLSPSYFLTDTKTAKVQQENVQSIEPQEVVTARYFARSRRIFYLQLNITNLLQGRHSHTFPFFDEHGYLRVYFTWGLYDSPEDIKKSIIGTLSRAGQLEHAPATYIDETW